MNTSLLGQAGPGLVSAASTADHTQVTNLYGCTFSDCSYSSLSRLIESFESIVIGLVEQENFTRHDFAGELTSFKAGRVRQDSIRPIHIHTLTPCMHINIHTLTFAPSLLSVNNCS